ncbi:MAG TPA: response regulator [Stellaceae bacterium]|jgi:two-component system cell cycle response regulator DivK|nr:response regulator [Stellaceae bacterium]
MLSDEAVRPNDARASDAREGKLILIVEDNELNMRLLNDVLEAHGYSIIKTDQGEVAVELALRERPDVILMDIQLPDISGLEATRRIKEDERTRDIPVIAVTAFAMSGDEKRIRDSGADAYVSKPIMLQPFLALLESYAGGTVASA